jgi:outer membrane lipoprotein-sorting protein
MKKIVSAGAIGLLVAGLCSLPAAGQGVEEIRAKMIEAQGGEATFRGVKDMTAKGSLDIIQQGITGSLIVYKKEPNKRRSDIEVMGILITQSYDGSTGWYINPQMGTVEDMNEEQLTAIKRQAMPIISELEPDKYGISYKLLGKEDLEGKPHFVLEQSFDDGFTIKNYVDTETYLTTKSVFTGPGPLGYDVTTEQFSSDFRKVGDMVMAFKVVTFQDGEEYTNITLSEVVFNTSLEDSLFEKEK